MKPLAAARLYGIVDLGYVTDIVRATSALIEGGVDILQLRAKGESASSVARMAREIHALTFPAGVPLVINDFPEVLRDVPAEGVHVGQDDAAVSDARAAAGRPCLVGKSTHSLDQARRAADEGADYIGFGPLFATPTKPGRPAVGLADIRALHEAVGVPIFCIGGIKPANVREVCAAGARRVVVVSGWLQADNISEAVRQTRKTLEKAC